MKSYLSKGWKEKVCLKSCKIEFQLIYQELSILTPILSTLKRHSKLKFFAWSCLLVCFEIVSHSVTQADFEVLFWDILKLAAVRPSAEIIGTCLHAQFLCGIF